MTFERWDKNTPTNKEVREPYIRFGDGKSLFMNVKFCDALKEQNLHRFDIFVDVEKRVIGMKFYRDENGSYEITHRPAQFAMSAFVHQYHPTLCVHIPMKFDDESGMWIGHLDGEKME